MLIYKIVPRTMWEDAVRDGVFAGSEHDLRDGFIHFSSARQAAETARKHFADQNDLLLVAVEPEALGDGLKWEPSRGGELFPHLYGPLQVGLARSVEPLPIGTDGTHVFPVGFSTEN